MNLNYVTKTEDLVPVRNVLISVADKTNLEEFIPGLLTLLPKINFYSTGGTYTRLKTILGRNAATVLHRVSAYTGQPEMQGGLVKTLDFKIYLGLLSESFNNEHRNDLERTGGITFDMTVVNLYPFAETIAKADASLENARANIDIGGPCMLRASAKNFLRVAPICDPRDYSAVLAELRATRGCTGLKQRFRLARKAIKHTALYDTAIASYLEEIDPEKDLDLYSLSENME
ncbi:hypothetical protein [Marispirochaeta sp.]|uniref:hypothetical protein n=1 Tax=Marispirochaeta sp. TaxID=2038653 RepID=UPI0029C82B4B|nr:hypothetical protein [Marispirochaeta sp.]